MNQESVAVHSLEPRNYGNLTTENLSRTNLSNAVSWRNQELFAHHSLEQRTYGNCTKNRLSIESRIADSWRNQESIAHKSFKPRIDSWSITWTQNSPASENFLDHSNSYSNQEPTWWRLHWSYNRIFALKGVLWASRNRRSMLREKVCFIVRGQN